MVEAMWALKSGAHSQPPMGSAFQATQAPETPRTSRAASAKADSLSTGSRSGQRLQFPTHSRRAVDGRAARRPCR